MDEPIAESWVPHPYSLLQQQQFATQNERNDQQKDEKMIGRQVGFFADCRNNTASKQLPACAPGIGGGCQAVFLFEKDFKNCQAQTQHQHIQTPRHHHDPRLHATHFSSSLTRVSMACEVSPARLPAFQEKVRKSALAQKRSTIPVESRMLFWVVLKKRVWT